MSETFVPLCLGYLTQYGPLKVFLFNCKFHVFIFFHNWVYFIVYRYHIFTIHSLIEGHFHCFHFLAVGRIILWTLLSNYLWSRNLSLLGKCQGMVYPCDVVDLLLAFWEFSTLFSIVPTPVCSLTINEGSPISTTLLAFGVCFCFSKPF